MLQFFYDEDGRPMAFCYDRTDYYTYLLNLQGDVIAILDSNYNVVVEYTYSAYGQVMSVTGSLASIIGQINPLRYRGYYYDVETGFYYLNSRYYDPVVGRFLNPDSLVASTGDGVNGLNMYAYCFNNPVNMSDSTGNWPKWAEDVAKVAAVALVATTAIVVVGVVTAGTGGMALAAAGVAFGAACGGLVGGIVNESKGESFTNGYIGGAISGTSQSVGTVLGGPAGTTLGGALGSGIGTVVTESLNNIGKPNEQQKSTEEIAIMSIKSVVIGGAMGTVTAGFDYAITSAVQNQAYGLMPGLTAGFGELMKGFFGAIDDAFVSIFD